MIPSSSPVRISRKRTGLLVGFLFLLSLIVACLFASAAVSSTSAAEIYARTTKKTFTASQASSVKLIYIFRKRNTSYSLELAIKSGSKWKAVTSKSYRGSFKGKQSKAVEEIFAGKRVKLGRYRVTISGKHDTKTVGFRIVKKAAWPTGVVPFTASGPTISGSTVLSKTLIASPGAWTGNPTPAFSYQWRRCGSGGGCSDIDGATASTYTLVADDVGSTIRVRVTATNEVGSADATSAQTDVVGT